MEDHIPLGAISEGTLRPQDLARALLYQVTATVTLYDIEAESAAHADRIAKRILSAGTGQPGSGYPWLFVDVTASEPQPD